jgi:hypothetical protein
VDAGAVVLAVGSALKKLKPFCPIPGEVAEAGAVARKWKPLSPIPLPGALVVAGAGGGTLTVVVVVAAGVGGVGSTPNWKPWDPILPGAVVAGAVTVAGGLLMVVVVEGTVALAPQELHSAADLGFVKVQTSHFQLPNSAIPVKGDEQ